MPLALQGWAPQAVVVTAGHAPPAVHVAGLVAMAFGAAPVHEPARHETPGFGVLHAPPEHVFLWQTLPSYSLEQLGPVRFVCVHVEPQESEVQTSLSSQFELTGVPTQVPLEHRSGVVQAMPSLHDTPVSGVMVHDEEPLQVDELQGSLLEQVIPVPVHAPPDVHLSLNVQGFESLQVVPVIGVTVHDEVPLQVDVLHWSPVHVMVVPPQVPELQVSLNVQAFPSLHGVPLSGVTVHDDVPLQLLS